MNKSRHIVMVLTWNIVMELTVYAGVTTAYTFSNPSNGSNPQASLLLATNGKFYGTTYGGGAGGDGTIFEIDARGDFKLIASFTGNLTSGICPCAALVEGADGLLYGTTRYCRDKDNGTVFSVSATGSFQNIYSFSELSQLVTGTNADGANPEAPLVQGTDGSFFGTARLGGKYGVGTIFKINPQKLFSVVHTFDGGPADGGQPTAGLTKAPDGNFYGVTSGGGAGVNGILFRMTEDGSFVALHSFAPDNGIGYNPEGSGFASTLCLGADGRLYGTRSDGGAFGNGTIYSSDTNGLLTVLHAFNPGGYGTNDENFDGYRPIGNLTAAANGGFIGTALYGGKSGFGTIYEINSAGWFTLLHAFSGKSGDAGYPASGLTATLDGRYYGTTTGQVENILDTLDLKANALIARTESGTSISRAGSVVAESEKNGRVYSLSFKEAAQFSVAPFTSSYERNAEGSTEVGLIRLEVSKNGFFTARALDNRGNESIHGNFDSSGNYRDGNLELHYSSPGGGVPSVITGYIDAIPFTAYQKIVSTAARPASDAGGYTLLLPANLPATSSIPAGTGFGVMTIGKDGTVLVVGRLADDKPFSIGSFLTMSGSSGIDQCSLYSVLAYSEAGVLGGTLTFLNVTGTSDCAGALTWLRPVEADVVDYPNGFTTTLNAIGSRYVSPKPSTLPLNFDDVSPNATVTFNGADFLTPLVKEVSVFASDSDEISSVGVNAPGPDDLRMHLNLRTGTFGGFFVSPQSGELTRFRGGLFEKRSFGAGYFMDEGQGGSVLLQPAN